MFDFRRVMTCMNSMELQDLVCDVAQACALHVLHKDYVKDGFDQPLFCKTFQQNYDLIFKLFSDGVSDEEIPF